jgi:phage-related protein
MKRMHEVFFFRTAAGNEPVLEFLRELPKPDRAVIGADLLTVQFGFPLGMPLCRALGGGLHEVRSSLPSRREARMIFFVDGQRIIVVVHGFIKKAQKTPDADLNRARDRKAEYERNQKQMRGGKDT